MTTGTIIINGVLHGKTIELEEEPGMPEGLAVSVVLRPALASGEGLRQSFGAWAKDAKGLQQFIEGIYRERNNDRAEPQSWATCWTRTPAEARWC